MSNEIVMTIENKLISDTREMNVYHHNTRSAYMVSSRNSVSVPLGLKNRDDYIHLSIVSGPGFLDSICVITIPSWVDFEFNSLKDGSVAHSRGRITVKIPPGLPVWQLRIKRPLSGPVDQTQNRIVIGECVYKGDWSSENKRGKKWKNQSKQESKCS